MFTSTSMVDSGRDCVDHLVVVGDLQRHRQRRVRVGVDKVVEVGDVPGGDDGVVSAVEDRPCERVSEPA